MTPISIVRAGLVLVCVAVLACGKAVQQANPAAESPRRAEALQDAGAPETRPASAPVAESRPGSRPEFDDVPFGSRDPVVDGLKSVIREMILKGLPMDQQPRLAARLVVILERGALGEEATRRIEADLMSKTLLSAQADFRPKKPGPPKTVLTPDDEQRVRSAAQALAKDLYVKLQPIVLPKHAAGQHTILRSAPNVKMPAGYDPITWKTLGGFEYTEHMELPEEVKKLNGKKVGVTGYMMTIEEVENIHEFLLVEAFWSCCFGTPPNVNQVLMIRIEKGVEYTSSPVLILGTLEVGEQIEDGFVTSVYRIKATSVAPTE